VLNPATREAYTAGEYERRLLNLPDNAPSPTLYRPGARDSSNGYRGRTGIYELVVIDEHMRAMIHDGASELELERHARTRTPGIRDDGRAKVLAGITTIEEVLKVTRED
jgi:general secretion pathway protein E